MLPDPSAPGEQGWEKILSLDHREDTQTMKKSTQSHQAKGELWRVWRGKEVGTRVQVWWRTGSRPQLSKQTASPIPAPRGATPGALPEGCSLPASFSSRRCAFQ